MKSFLNVMIALCFMLSYSTINAQIKNSEKVTVKINGNCGMCKSKIEKAGNLQKESKVVWDATSKTATVIYDSKKTTIDSILKRIALVGYDNELFSAPDSVYENLHGCCQYDRTPFEKVK